MCMYMQDMKFLGSNRNGQGTIHNYIGLSVFMHFANFCTRSVEILSACVFVCLSLYLCVCLSLCLFVSVLCVYVFLCVKVLKEELKFVFVSVNN